MNFMTKYCGHRFHFKYAYIRIYQSEQTTPVCGLAGLINRFEFGVEQMIKLLSISRKQMGS